MTKRHTTIDEIQHARRKLDWTTRTTLNKFILFVILKDQLMGLTISPPLLYFAYRHRIMYVICLRYNIRFASQDILFAKKNKTTLALDFSIELLHILYVTAVCKGLFTVWVFSFLKDVRLPIIQLNILVKSCFICNHTSSPYC